MIQLLMQTNPPTGGENDGLGMITGAMDVAKATAAGWEESWTTLFDPNTGLWAGLVKLGIALAAVSILYLSMTSGKEIIDRQSWSELIALFIWPIVIMLFLGQNGNLLAKTITMERNFAHKIVTDVLEAQLGEVTFKKAITDVTLTGTYKTQIENLYKDCEGKAGEDLTTCWTSKQPQAQQILTAAEQQAGGALPGLSNFINSVQNMGTGVNEIIGSIFKATMFQIIRVILFSLQWAFTNMLEAALLMTALFAPIAMGMSLLPLQGRPIWAWASGFIALFGIQLGYNIVVGLSAAILVKSGAEESSDIAFLFFLAIFAPILASLIAGGGGIALYNGIASNVKQLIDVGSNLVGATTNIIASGLERR